MARLLAAEIATFKRRQDLRANAAAYDIAAQDRLLAACAELTGEKLPV